MQINLSRMSMYILVVFFFVSSEISSANYNFQNEDGDILLSLKKKKTKKLCNKSFYLNDIEVKLSSKGLLTISLTQTSKTSEGYLTHVAVEILDRKERVLTVCKTGKLELEDDEESKSYFFSENLNYQFSPEEFKIFIENAKRLRVGYKGCNGDIPDTEEKVLERKLPEAIVEENFNKTPSNSKNQKTNPEESTSTSYVVLSKQLNLRKFARINGSDVLCVLQKGDVVDIIEKRDGWWLIKFYSPILKKRFVGFVHSDFLLPLEFSY